MREFLFGLAMLLPRAGERSSGFIYRISGVGRVRHGKGILPRFNPIREEKRGPMNFRFKTAAAALLAVSLVASYAQTSETKPPVKKHTAAKKTKAPAAPTVEEQIQALRQELRGQIDSLKGELSEKDAQLQKAQQAAADAQTEAAKAEAVAAQQQQAASDNATAVSTLQATVTDLKGNQASLATTVSDETAKIKKEFANPTSLHYKGIEITPGGYVAAETVDRTKATGGDIPTAFNALPYEHSDNYSLSEFYGTARQSRLSLLAEGKTNWGTLRGYYEADFLGTGTSSNNNQSNSYVLRQRILYAEAKTHSGWTFAGGQLWSLATEDAKGITSAPGDVLTPQTIDPNYVPGFVWERQYGFRVVKSTDHVALGVSVENPQILYTATLAGNTPYAVLGSAGTGGGNYNATVTSCSPTTYVQNYSSVTDSGGNTVAEPVYNTINVCSNATNISFNSTPDFVVKLAVDPGFGHWEVFGIGRSAHETVYPGITTNSYKWGGITDVVATAAAGTTQYIAPALTTAGATSNKIWLGGFGGSTRFTVAKKLSLGGKALYGPGVGRYGDSGLSDVTSDSNGNLAPIHNFSGLLTAELKPTPRLTLYLNYGGDYAGRTDFANASATTLSGISAAEVGTVWGATAGKNKTNQAVGYGSQQLSNASCLTNTNPGYSGSGFNSGGSCGAQTRDVQEVTGGYWYDIFKGDHGRLRQSIQYGYAVREGWSGAVPTGGTVGLGAKGIDNMIFTSFRFYLP
jgi:hypothetical protein